MPEEEGVWVTKYYFCMDDGVHGNRVAEFTDLEEAKKYYEEQEKLAMADEEKYFVDMGCGSTKEEWTEDFFPDIGLEEWKVLMKDGEEVDMELVDDCLGSVSASYEEPDPDDALLLS